MSLQKKPILTIAEQFALLEALESYDCELSDIDFQLVCDRDPHTFGEKTVHSSGKRRKFQKRFDTIKRLSDTGYRKLLHRYGIAPNKNRMNQGEYSCRIVSCVALTLNSPFVVRHAKSIC